MPPQENATISIKLVTESNIATTAPTKRIAPVRLAWFWVEFINEMDVLVYKTENPTDKISNFLCETLP